MRKYRKEQVLELFSSVLKANQRVTELILENKRDELFGLLSDMQQALVTIGTTIESSEDDSDSIIKELEQSCELLWRCSQEQSTNNALQNAKQISRGLVAIEKELHKIQEQIIMIFLPYKASMWDSMESVWDAANKDTRISCYVMPIPYFQKEKDGSFGTMHYEGSEFPEKVSIIDYKTVDLEKVHPEVIYFHNPYDQHNFITSIHPMYYSSALKKCTEHLVYIPYFCSIDDVPKHYCETLGVLNADKVIVQSEKVRQTYINCYIRLLGEAQQKQEQNTGIRQQEFWDRLFLRAQNKYIALGSPKFDKTLACQYEEIELPKQWMEITRKRPNAKIIFYNTHLNGLMKSRADSFLPQLEQTLQYFKMRSDVILLWRPHPLSGETAQALNPEIIARYKAIVEEYKEEAWGIYDESPELHRAIAISDAYYGDRSSVASLFKYLRKPVLLQNRRV